MLFEVMMLREEWENSEEAQSILLVYNHATGEISSQVFFGYECGFKVRAREEELEEILPCCSFGIIDNKLATEQWLSVVLRDFYERMEEEDELDLDENADINYPY